MARGCRTEGFQGVRASPHQGGRAVAEPREAFVGIDAAKARNAVAVAEGGRGGEVRYLGEVDAAEPGMRRIVARLAAKYDRVHFCYGRSRRDRRADRLRAAPAHRRSRVRVHGRRAVADPEEAGRPSQDQPARRRDIGEAAERRRADAGDDIAPLRVELSASIPRPRLRDRPRGGSPPPALKRYRPPEGSPNRGGPDEAVRGEAAGPGRAGQL